LCSDCDTDRGRVCRWLLLPAVVAVVTASVTMSARSQSAVVCRVCCTVCTIARSSMCVNSSGDCVCTRTCGRWWRRSRAPCPTTCHSDSLVWLLLLLYADTACVAPLPLSLLYTASDVCIGACRVWVTGVRHGPTCIVPSRLCVCMCVCVSSTLQASLSESVTGCCCSRSTFHTNEYIRTVIKEDTPRQLPSLVTNNLHALDKLNH
jgi:hypothetical protein